MVESRNLESKKEEGKQSNNLVQIMNQHQPQNPNDLFVRMPKKVKVFLCTYLNTVSLIHLSKTAKYWEDLIFKDETKVEDKTLKQITNASNDSLRKLLSHVALGEYDDAQKIWEQDPSLLTCRGTVYHPNRIYQVDKDPVDIPFDQNPGRPKYVNCTAWQIALMNEEYEKADEMAKHMREEEMQIQYAKAFPNGLISRFDLEETKRLLQIVFNEVFKDTVIDKNDLSKMSEGTKKALHALYDYIKPQAEHKTGLVFDARIYAIAVGFYEKKYDNFKNNNKRIFWCIRVEEYIAALLGTGYLRTHAQGEYKNNRTYEGCHLSDKSSYFSFRREFLDYPGYSFFVNGLGKASRKEIGSQFPKEHVWAKAVRLVILPTFLPILYSKSDTRNRLIHYYKYSNINFPSCTYGIDKHLEQILHDLSMENTSANGIDKILPKEILQKILNMIDFDGNNQERVYKVNFSSVMVNNRNYDKSAAKIKLLIEKNLRSENLSIEKFDEILLEIKSELSNKTKPSTGFLFSYLGARDVSIAELYTNIIDLINKLESKSQCRLSM